MRIKIEEHISKQVEKKMIFEMKRFWQRNSDRLRVMDTGIWMSEGMEV